MSERKRSQSRRQFIISAGLTAVGGELAINASMSRADQKVEPTAGIAGIKKLLAGKAALTWVLTGDSITHGALHTKGWRSYPEHFAERVRWELRRMRDVVINTGISGDRTGGLLADIQWRALRFQPHVISVMLGMNDAASGKAGRETFRKNLTAITDKILAAGAVPLLNTPNTIYLKNAKNRADLPAYAASVRDVAKQTKAALVDHWEHWSKAKPNQEDLLAWIEDRSIHPNVYGHREFAKLIFRALGIFDSKNPTCSLEVP